MAKAAKKAGAKKSQRGAMPAWEKPGEELIEKFYAALPDEGFVERKKMFGLPCAFVQGNMATGIFGHTIFVRFDEQRRVDWIKNKAGRPFEPAPGRAMKEYIVLPQNVVDDSVLLRQVVRQSLDYVQTLKPKRK